MILLLLACARDADFDGFVGSDDCDPHNAEVYPGAPDLPGDGIDNDCDGSDAEYRFVGDWNLTDLAAEFAGVQAIVPGGAFGSLTVHDSESLSTNLTVPVSPELVALTLPVNVDGTASPIPQSNDFHLSVTDILFDERVNLEWDCFLTLSDAFEDDLLLCVGSLLVLGINLDATAHFERR